jgi:hypothetical protein
VQNPTEPSSEEFVSHDKAIEDASVLFRLGIAELKQLAEDVGDDHSVGICSCSVIHLWMNMLSWLHDYSKYEKHTPHMEIVDFTDEFDPVWQEICSECGKPISQLSS